MSDTEVTTDEKGEIESVIIDAAGIRVRRDGKELVGWHLEMSIDGVFVTFINESHREERARVPFWALGNRDAK